MAKPGATVAEGIATKSGAVLTRKIMRAKVGAKAGAKLGAELGVRVGTKATGKTTQDDRRSMDIISFHRLWYKPGANAHKSNDVSNPNRSDED